MEKQPPLTYSSPKSDDLLWYSSSANLGVELLYGREYWFAGNNSGLYYYGNPDTSGWPCSFQLSSGDKLPGFLVFFFFFSLSVVWKVCHGCTRFFFYKFERGPGSSPQTTVCNNPLEHDGMPGLHPCPQILPPAGMAQGSALSGTPQLWP